VREETLKIGNFLDLNLCAPIPKPINLALLRETLTQIAHSVQKQKRAASVGW